jgi:ribosomal protein L11 methyltransferase
VRLAIVRDNHPRVSRAAPIRVAPRWEILPLDGDAGADALALRLAPGLGFGDGRHPTTQLSLQAIAALAPRGRAWRLLDFGSGSGILSIAGARLGATVDAVEIDPRAVEHAGRNLRANGVAERIRQLSALGLATGPFDLIVANILRSVLLAFADELVGLRACGGALVLSGLVSTDVPEVIARYARPLAGARPEVYERDDWRALVWR